MDEPSALVELDDRWLLPYRGMQVIQVRVSYQLTLLLDAGAEVQVETEALLTHGPLCAPGAEPARLVPERQEVAPALVLFGVEVLSAVVFKSGALRLVFNSGSHLNVKPHPKYEAWGVHGPGKLHLVCQPGGGVDVWL